MLKLKILIIQDIYQLKKIQKKKYAQIRMIAKIKNIGVIRPDKDNGKTYKRFISNIRNVK